MYPANEDQPFLRYHDDPTAEEQKSNHDRSRFQHYSIPHRTSLISHLIVFTTTSVLWIMIIPFIVAAISPEDSLNPFSPSSTSSSTSNNSKNISLNRHNITTNASLVTCGNNLQSAKQSGCKYDVLLNSWVPAPCYDQEFIDEYKDDASWTGYADYNLTQPLSVAEMSEREYYYTSPRDHINHCAIMWRKQFFSLFEERFAFDTMIASPHHTDHCSQYLMDVAEKHWVEPTKTVVVFAGCWIRE
jgi:hypothetical protein